MKLLLTLLAILTGFAGADRAVAAPATPAVRAAVLALADVTAQRVRVAPAHRPVTNLPSLAHNAVGRTMPPVQWIAGPAVRVGIDRARE